MPKIIARNTFVLLALGFTLSVTDLSAQSRAEMREPSRWWKLPKNRKNKIIQKS